MYIAIGNSIGASSRVNRGGGGGGFTNTYSLAFDGVDDFVDLGSGTSLEFTNDFSVSVWIKETGSLNRGIFCCGNRSGTSGWMIYRTSANKVAFSVYTANNRVATSTTSINNGDWFNVIGTFEKNGTANQQVKIYINGTFEGQNGWISSQTPTYSGTIYKQIAFPYAGSNEFLGNIDEVSAFNYLLSTDEINTISTTPSDLSSLNPSAWYRNGDNGSYKSPQWLIPENSNKDKVSNYSFEFDGVDDYIQLGSAVSFASEFSLSVWFKPNGFSTSQVILGNGTSSNNWLRLNSASSITFKIANTSLNFADVGNNLVDGVWQHLLLYRDSSNNVGIFRNGSAFSTNQSNTNTLELSTIAKRGSIEYTGSIDDIAFWQSDKSSDVATIYNSGTPTTLPSGAVAHWKMGEEATFSTNWTVPDAVGSNDGTSANMSIEDRVGDASNSSNNAVSFNMTESDRETDVPS